MIRVKDSHQRICIKCLLKNLYIIAQFSLDKIPKIEAICNWISKYSAETKKNVANKILANSSA